jgi:hypothetical protein
MVKERPHIVVWEGRLLQDRMERVNVTEEEVRAAVRAAGKASLADIQAVVLENDGEWSVVPREDAPDLVGVRRAADSVAIRNTRAARLALIAPDPALVSPIATRRPRPGFAHLPDTAQHDGVSSST